MLLLILLCTFIKNEHKKKHNWKTGHFFIFSMGLFQSKSNDIFLSLQENICLVFIRSAAQSLTSTHNLCFLGGMREKKYFYNLILRYFSLMRGISLRIRAVWSGRSFSAYLLFAYATKIPFLMSQYLYKYISRFTWNVVLLNIIKQKHCEIWRQAKLQIRKLFSYFSKNIYNVFNH